MTKQIVLLGLVVALVAGTSGCHLLGGPFWVPGGCGPYGACGPCEPGFCEPCGPVCDPCGPVCETACEPCGPVCGEVCYDPCAGPCHGPGIGHSLLALVGGLFHAETWCGPVCGERYWGDFHGAPPACYDPCDCQGNYVGGCQTCGIGGPGGVPVDGVPAYAQRPTASPARIVQQQPRVAPAPRVASPHRAQPMPRR